MTATGAEDNKERPKAWTQGSARGLEVSPSSKDGPQVG